MGILINSMNNVNIFATVKNSFNKRKTALYTQPVSSLWVLPTKSASHSLCNKALFLSRFSQYEGKLLGLYLAIRLRGKPKGSG